MSDQIPGEYLREIGRVAIEWNRVDRDVELVIWTLLFVDALTQHALQREIEGRAVTTHLNPLLRIDIMNSLAAAAFKDSALTEQIANFGKEVKRLYPARNKIVHGLWQVAREGVAIRETYRARGEVTPFYDFMTAQEIAAVADEITELHRRHSTLYRDLALAVRLQREPYNWLRRR